MTTKYVRLRLARVAAGNKTCTSAELVSVHSVHTMSHMIVAPPHYILACRGESASAQPDRSC